MPAPMRVFVINLDRSPERLRSVRESAEAFGIELTRVPAVDGGKLPPGRPLPVDTRTFERIHGKRILPGEIGCYLSHLDTLEAIAAGDDLHAVIVEDDVRFTAGFLPFLDKLRRLEGWDAVKLVNHRTRGFVTHAAVGDAIRIGRCAHGPCGSSAAYVVTKAGAARLLQALTPMRLPYDVALERGWSGRGYSIFTTDKALVTLGSVEDSTIAAASSVYQKATFPPYKRIGTLIFRVGDYLRRTIYAFQGKDMSRRTL